MKVSRQIFVLLCLQLALAAAALDRVYSPRPLSLAPGVSIVDTIPAGAQDIKIHARVAAREWSLRVGPYIFRLGAVVPQFDDAHTTGRYLTVSRDGHELDRQLIREAAMRDSEPTSIVVTTFRDKMRVYAGANTLSKPLTFPAPSDTLIWGIESGQKMRVTRLMDNYEPPLEILYRSPDDLPTGNADTTSPVGCWQYFDRENDEAVTTIGGAYTLAIVPAKDARGVYDIIYIDGATVHPELWQRGRVKGRLTQGPFVGVYSLVWYDAMGRPRGDDAEASATLEADGQLLRLSLPLLSATIRLARLP